MVEASVLAHLAVGEVGGGHPYRAAGTGFEDEQVVAVVPDNGDVVLRYRTSDEERYRMTLVHRGDHVT